MRDFMEIYQKRLLSGQKIVMYRGFPNAPEIQVMPPSQPSPLIDSYIERDGSGWFALKPEDENILLYVKDDEKVQVVEPDVADESSMYGRLDAVLTDLFFNAKSDATASAGHLSEGFNQAVTDLKVQAFSLEKYLKEILLIVAAFMVLIVISKIT